MAQLYRSEVKTIPQLFAIDLSAIINLGPWKTVIQSPQCNLLTVAATPVAISTMLPCL